MGWRRLPAMLIVLFVVGVVIVSLLPTHDTVALNVPAGAAAANARYRCPALWGSGRPTAPSGVTESPFTQPCATHDHDRDMSFVDIAFGVLCLTVLLMAPGETSLRRRAAAAT
jgi:hypothetical protein